MEENLGSFKVLEDVSLKATYNLEINGRQFEPGETIVRFDKIQVAGLNELREYVAARGGFDNRGLVFWEKTQAIRLNFSQGVFSNSQFSLLNNCKMIKVEEESPVRFTMTEELESNENGYITTKYVPEEPYFVYDKYTGEKYAPYRIGDQLHINKNFQDVIVTYSYDYINGASIAKIGQSAINSFVELEGKTRVKDDTSGLITTGIIKIPQLKLMSDLSIRLGAQANPVVGTFVAEGVPYGSRRDSYVMEIYFLNNDIDSDM